LEWRCQYENPCSRWWWGGAAPAVMADKSPASATNAGSPHGQCCKVEVTGMPRLDHLLRARQSDSPTRVAYPRHDREESRLTPEQPPYAAIVRDLRKRRRDAALARQRNVRARLRSRSMNEISSLELAEVVEQSTP